MDNGVEVVQVGPTGRELDHHTAGGFTHPSGHLDQPRAPCARLAFAQRVALTTAVMPTAPLTAGKGFHGNGFTLGLVRRIGDNVAHADQQVIGRRVKVETEQVGEVAMIAETVGQQSSFEFFVAVLALAAIGVAVVGGPWQNRRARTVGDHGAAIGALGVGFALHDDPPLGRPRIRPIPERREQTLRLASCFPL